MIAPPATTHLREGVTNPHPDLYVQRLLMLADYLEANPQRHNQSCYIHPAYMAMPDTRLLALWNSEIKGCAAGLAVLMFGHEDAEISGGGGIVAHNGGAVSAHQKARELLGISPAGARSLFAACAPCAGVIASLRALANGDNVGPVMREYEPA